MISKISLYITFKNVGKEINDNFKIIKSFSNFFIIQNNSRTNILIYFKNNIFNIDDIVHIKGAVSEIKNINSFHNSNNVYLQIYKASVYLYEKVNTNYFSNKDANTRMFLNLFIFSKQIDKNSEIIQMLKEMSIVHYFIISGFHFGIIYFIFKKIFEKIRLVKASEYLSLLLLFIYLCMLKFPISAFRAFIFLLLRVINQKLFNKKLSNLTLLAFIATLFLIFDYSLIFNYSFIFSFVLTFVILLTNNIFRNAKKEYLKNIWISLFTYFSSLLISLTLVEKISIFSFIYQLFFGPIIFLSYTFSILFFWTKYLSMWYFNFLSALIKLIYKTNIEINIGKKLIYLPFIIHALYILIYMLISLNRNYLIYKINSYFLTYQLNHFQRWL